MEIKCAYTELADVATLVSNPRNPNKHSEKQIQLLAKIMKHQGWRSPIVVSKRSGFIVKGHGRLAAAKLNGWSSAPVDKQDYATEADEWADMIADNEIARLAEADQSLIRELALELPEGFDLDLLGIPDFEIAPVVEAQCDEDFVPEVLEPKVKPGELYILGNHRLLCGDSTNIQHVERLMGGEKADMVFTDPPYGMDLNVNFDEMFKGDTSKHLFTGNRFKKVEGDNKDYDPNPIFAIEAKDYFVWGADYFYDKLPAKGSWTAWDKRTNESMDKVVGNTTEFCWSKNPHRRMTARILWSGHHGMQKDDSKKRVHPTQKPVALAEWFFEQYATKHKTVVDIYGGSGSTLIACEKTNRKCFMMELDPHYCSVILDRYAKFSGKDPIREDNIKWSEIKNGN